MRFYLRKKRQPPAIIIVALIDVLIVVLIFLMVTTSFKKPLSSFKLVLPESTQATKSGVTENPPISIVIEADGNLRYGPNSQSVTADRLRAELAAATATNNQVKVIINADKKAPVGQFVRVMDAAKEAKVKAIDFATRPTATP